MTRRLFEIELCIAAFGVSATGAQADEAGGHKAGVATIITGPHKDTAEVRSTRFR
jgi:hypothetical protein